MHKYLFKKLKEQKILVVDDTTQYIKNNNMENTAVDKFIEDFSIKSGLIKLLITYKGQILGLIAVHFTRKKFTFSQDNIDFIKTVADQQELLLTRQSFMKKKRKQQKRKPYHE